jgi:large subunit ribosomal protein L21
MEAYAVIETGGKQYRVQAGDELEIERIDGVEAGGKISLSPVLARNVSGTLEVGTPAIEGAAVEADVIEETRGKKVVAFKKKRRKGYHRKVGHRQDLLKVKITTVA